MFCEDCEILMESMGYGDEICPECKKMVFSEDAWETTEEEEIAS